MKKDKERLTMTQPAKDDIPGKPSNNCISLGDNMNLYDINGRLHYSLWSVRDRIGLTYHEVYHNLDAWSYPLGIIKIRNILYVNKKAADEFIKETPGYVPIEYRNKRPPLKNFTGTNMLERKEIRQSIWVRYFHATKQSLTR